LFFPGFWLAPGIASLLNYNLSTSRWCLQMNYLTPAIEQPDGAIQTGFFAVRRFEPPAISRNRAVGAELGY
jgi:hypothetical protein